MIYPDRQLQNPGYPAYKEQVMEEIRQEAESYGMTVEAYAANGYEPQKGAADKIRKGGGVLAM